MAEMHSMFATWVSSLHSSGEADETKVREWWVACKEQIDASNAGDVVELVRVAFGHPGDEFDAEWRARVAQHDSLFPLRGADHKVAVIAAAAVMLASESPKLGDVAQVARLCATRAGWSPSIEELGGDPARLRELASSQRTVAAWPRRAPITLGLEAAKAPITTAVNEGTGITPDVLSRVVEALGAATDASVAKALARVQELTAKRELPLREQSDVLIWLMRGRSTVLDLPWRELAQTEAAIAAAIELNGLSRFPVGREDAAALIGFKVASADKKAKADPERLRPLVTVVDDLDGLVPLGQAVAAGEIPDEPTAEDLGLFLHDELNLARLVDGS